MYNFFSFLSYKNLPSPGNTFSISTSCQMCIHMMLKVTQFIKVQTASWCQTIFRAAWTLNWMNMTEKTHTSDLRGTLGEYCELPSISVNCDLLWERASTHIRTHMVPLHTFSVYRVKHLTEKRQDSSTFSRPPKNKFSSRSRHPVEYFRCLQGIFFQWVSSTSILAALGHFVC